MQKSNKYEANRRKKSNKKIEYTRKPYTTICNFECKRHQGGAINMFTSSYTHVYIHSCVYLCCLLGTKIKLVTLQGRNAGRQVARWVLLAITHRLIRLRRMITKRYRLLSIFNTKKVLKIDEPPKCVYYKFEMVL